MLFIIFLNVITSFHKYRSQTTEDKKERKRNRDGEDVTCVESWKPWSLGSEEGMLRGEGEVNVKK